VFRLVSEYLIQSSGFLGDRDHVLKIRRKQIPVRERPRQFLAAP
jgi:hypothetical protein